MIKKICDRNVEVECGGDNAKREFAIISKHVMDLIKQLEE